MTFLLKKQDFSKTPVQSHSTLKPRFKHAHLILLQLAQNTFTFSVCSFQAEPAALLLLNFSDIWLGSSLGSSGDGETLGMNPQLPASPVPLWLSRDALLAPLANPTVKPLLISSCSAYLFFSAPLCAQPAGLIVHEASQTFTVLVSRRRFPGSVGEGLEQGFSPPATEILWCLASYSLLMHMSLAFLFFFFSGVFYLFIFSPFCAVLKQGSLLSSQRALEMLPPISFGVNPC